MTPRTIENRAHVERVIAARLQREGIDPCAHRHLVKKLAATRAPMGGKCG